MKDILRARILALGADVCGFAGAAFPGAPDGFSPKDVYPECRSVIVIGYALPKGAYYAVSRLVYTRFNALTCDIMDALLLSAAKLVERETGGVCVPLPCDAPYDEWDGETLTGRGIISMKHAACLAGLGALGKNSMFLSREFGNRLTLGALLASAEIEPDARAESACIAGCSKCVDICPVGAISGGRVDQSKCRPNAYGANARGFDIVNCNKCRLICPMRYGKA